MSVIMKALATKRSDEKQNTPFSSSAPSGVNVGATTFPGSPRSRRLSRRSKTLLLLLTLMGISSGGVYFYHRGGEVWTSVQDYVRPWLAGLKEEKRVEPQAPVVEQVALPLKERNTSDEIQEARNLFSNHLYDESLKRFQTLVQQQPDDAQLHNDLAMVFVKKELYSSAQKHLERALELNPECAICYGNLGYLKSLLKEHIEAEAYLKKAIRLKPDEAVFHFNLAVLYEKNGDLGSGAQHYQSFLDLSPDQNSELVQKVKERLYTLTGQ